MMLCFKLSIWVACSGLLVALGGSAAPASAMDVRVIEDQLFLSGQVIDGDAGRFEKALKANPKVTTIILRNSPGGHPQSGFRIGEIIRDKGLTTAVSGYCYSSCSRMYLGGARRIFTDDYPPGITNIGFHGHYKRDGSLDAPLMKQTGLRNWIIKFLGPTADISLVDRWVNIPKNSGMARFFNPGRVKHGGASAFFCNGSEAYAQQPFRCEAIGKSGLDIGVSTSSEIIQSRDQAEIRKTVPAAPPSSGFAQIMDISKLAVISDEGKAEYQRYLDIGAHKAFAVSKSGEHWSWAAGPADSMTHATKDCEKRAKSPCSLYALDDEVVWVAP